MRPPKSWGAACLKHEEPIIPKNSLCFNPRAILICRLVATEEFFVKSSDDVHTTGFFQGYFSIQL